MTSPIPRLTRTVAAVLLLTASSSSLRSATPAQEKLPAKCCFTNPSYSGTCEVQPAKDESCGQILEYLNNPMSQGKGYCGNTGVRSGWKSVACEPKKP
jgi:hypothetical protein